MKKKRLLRARAGYASSTFPEQPCCRSLSYTKEERKGRGGGGGKGRMRVIQTTEIFSGRLGMDEEGGHLIARFVQLVECKQPVSNVSKSRTRVLSRSLCGECALSGRQAGTEGGKRRREGGDGGPSQRKEGRNRSCFLWSSPKSEKQANKQASLVVPTHHHW
jgi:hypothetical protein